MLEKELKSFEREKILGEQKIQTYKQSIFNEINSIEDFSPLENVQKLKKEKKSFIKTFFKLFK